MVNRPPSGLRISSFGFRISVLLALMLAAECAWGQSNGVPGPQDFAAFSRFVADRNIFDPARQPHYYSTNSRPRPRRTRSAGAPDLQLVGTMSYEKGLFAFFTGNTSDMKKALQAGEQIAGYTVAEITPNEVRLESADKKQPLTLKVGDGLRQENGKWVPFDGSGVLAASPAGVPGTTEAPVAGEAGAAPAAPASATEPNDVLKRLMQLREKENQ